MLNRCSCFLEPTRTIHLGSPCNPIVTSRSSCFLHPEDGGPILFHSVIGLSHSHSIRHRGIPYRSSSSEQYCLHSIKSGRCISVVEAVIHGSAGNTILEFSFLCQPCLPRYMSVRALLQVSCRRSYFMQIPIHPECYFDPIGICEHNIMRISIQVCDGRLG